MEHLFSPCTRLPDLAESQGRLARFRDQDDIESLQELNLDISTEELLSAERAFTYADLYAMLGNGDTIAWLTPHAAVHAALLGDCGSAMICTNFVDADYSFKCDADGETIWAVAGSTEELSGICDVLLRLLAASAIHSVDLYSHSSRLGTLINATSLAYTMEQCQSLKALTLVEIALNEDEIRVLGVYSRPGLEIALTRCKITSAGASALAEVLGRNQGPTQLWCCDVDNFVIADGLRGNSRLKSLTPQYIRNSEVGNRELQLLAIASALQENKGLVQLALSAPTMSHETWGAICDSLKTHPTLEVLNLQNGDALLVPSALKSRIQALVDMLKVNMSIHTILLYDESYTQHELFRRSVIPYLETNRFRPRVRTIQKTRPIAYRAKLLGRALLAVRTDPNRFWMLLSGNPEVAFRSTTTTIAAAVDLLTPVAASVIPSLTTTVTGSFPSTQSEKYEATHGNKRKLVL
jgi:hypothetical protein